MRHCYVRWNKTAGIYKQTMGRVTELQSFFISRQKMTSVQAINHGALKWQISQSKWNYLGARAGGFFQGRAHILSSKICPKQVTQTPSNKHTHTHLHSHHQSCVSISPSMALCSQQHPFNHQTDTVSRHCSYKVSTWLSDCMHSSPFVNISRGYSAAGVLGLHVRQECVVCVWIVVWLPAEMLIW